MARPQPARWLIIAAFAAVYLIWGSTYLGIHVTVQYIPPFFMMGSRFALAGLILFIIARAQGAARPTRLQWRNAIVVGALLFLLNNGILVWAAQHIPSGILALLVASVTLWTTLIDWVFHGHRPTPATFLGLLFGFGGLALLITPGSAHLGDAIAPVAAVMVVFGTIGWASGSMYSRQADMPQSPLLSTGMQLLSGGLMLVSLGLVTGEGARLDVSAIPMHAILWYLYLFTFGSIIAFTAYVWLLRVTSPTRATTYAFVNPVVALILGAVLGGELLTERVVVAAVLIISAVALIILRRHQSFRLWGTKRLSAVETG
jgi:drug/metabolite transporter (DMT)-like permease